MSLLGNILDLNGGHSAILDDSEVKCNLKVMQIHQPMVLMCLIVRTTITISEQLYREAKARAAATGQTVSQVIEDAVREALRPKPSGAEPIADLPIYGGSGVLPGVDLSDPSALLDRMEEETALDALR